MNYFERAANMDVRYCEPFFDPQGHTRRGVSWETMMGGFRKAQKDAEKRYNVKSRWTMCMLRDLSPESAMKHYQAALPYRDMTVAIGIDSNELDRPPLLFDGMFCRARADGFHLTCHCDVGQRDTHEHIRQVVCTMVGAGGERIDHGLNAAEKPKLMRMILEKDIGMTICPWAYTRAESINGIFSRIRILYDTGIKISIVSDDPAYMDDSWVLHNMFLTKQMCKLQDEDMAVLVRSSGTICWADDMVKNAILKEHEEVIQKFREPSL